MKKLSLSLLLVIIALSGLAGCASKVERIGLQVELVKLERKADGSLLASLQFSNPNVDPINLVKSTHVLTLNGKPAGVLEVPDPLGLPAQQAVTTTTTLKPGAGTAAVSETVSYQLTSTLTLSIYDTDTEQFKTSSSGTVKLQ